ncbi:hypothetical protein ACIPZC_16850 [Pseudomonas sp. NPDC089743]|uniref:hypothetical protein n=1 Tax=Pseudomonas sp. NPDC089743 TaxID=3364471 RepID=UPI00381AF5A0
MDITDRLAKMLGTVYTGASSGSASVPGLSSGTPFFAATPVSSTQGSLALFVPAISINQSAETITWTFEANKNQSPSYITVGVF